MRKLVEKEIVRLEKELEAEQKRTGGFCSYYRSKLEIILRELKDVLEKYDKRGKNENLY